MQINPIEIKGNWDKGYVMDKHSISSTYLGENIRNLDIVFPTPPSNKTRG